MEVIGEKPPPLPPKTKKPIQFLVGKELEPHFHTIHSSSNNTVTFQNGFETGSLKIVNNRFRDEDGISPPLSLQLTENKVTEPQSNKTSAAERVSETVRVTKNESDISDSKNETFGPRIITWAESIKKTEEPKDLYENVNKGINLLNNLANKKITREVKSENFGTSGKKKVPKIEVRQEDKRTVVKISIKETPTPEEEMNGESRFTFSKENFYENGYQSPKGFTPVDSQIGNRNCTKVEDEGTIYENTKIRVEDDVCYENVSNNCYENVERNGPNERVYANVTGSRHGRRASKKELTTEANYCNLNGEDPECDQVYKNCEFQVSEKNIVSIINKNPTPTAKNLAERQDTDDELYENVKIDCHTYVNENLYQNGQKNVEKCNETAENLESRKKGNSEIIMKSSVELFLHKPETVAKVEKLETEFGDGHLDDSSSGDPFDSGACSDVDSLPILAQNKKGNVIVTIKTLQNEQKSDDMKKSEANHRRAESLTSSGVGVDSEESDDEKSNISCDSLNSNEPYTQSNFDDHGYHTPNSEDKTGSPIDQIEYEHVLKSNPSDSKTEAKISVDFSKDDYYEKTDIIQQVADASQKIKSLRMENSGVYQAKLIDPSEFEEYENIHVFEISPKAYKKKPAPPPPPSKPFTSLQQFCEEVDEETKKSLPTNLLQDIRSRNVRLSSTYPNGETPQNVKNTVANAIFNLQGSIPTKVKTTIKLKNVSPVDPKRAMVEERTYEERKTEVRKLNKICAMEVDTDKFYKFHLAENVRENAREGENGTDDETFAGLKDYLSREKPAAITSAKGTIRGVKNRVKAGIATFLQLHENKSYKDRDAGKVVVYTTTMGIVRETYHKCLKVKQILRTLMVKFEERDVFMSSEAQEEIRERMKCDVILVPQVFVEGQHIGDAETIERLNEMGELRTILKPYKSADACSTCKVCGGYRLLPCSVCKGSKKSIHRNHFTAEFVALKCMNCDQVGLTKCHAC